MKPNRNLNAHDIRFLQALAAALGDGWIYSQGHSHDHYAQLRNRHLRTVFIGISASRHHYHLSGDLDRSYYAYSTATQMQAGTHRSPAAVAAEVRRKLLPGMMAGLAAARAWLAQQVEKQNRQRWLAGCLRPLCDARDAGRYAPHLYDLRWQSGVTGHVGAAVMNDFDLHLNNLTLDQVIRIAGVLGSPPTGNPT